MTCSNSNFQSVPAFVTINITEDVFDIDLSKNNISTIDDGAFTMLLVQAFADIELDLSQNILKNISQEAFETVNKNIVYLDLSGNRLVTVPSSITNLGRLQTLLIVGNPLKMIDPTVFASIGKTLQRLSLNMSSLVFWPNSLKTLVALQELDVSGLTFSDIPKDAFEGFKNTLLELRIQDSYLPRLPASICLLTNVFEIELNSCYIDNSTLQCDSPVSSVIDLTMNNCNLTRFPDMLSVFSSLQSLQITNNRISDVEGFVIPINHPLNQLNMAFNRLTNIPFALTKLKNIEQLNLNFNRILAVQFNDLRNFTELTYLELNSNGIEKVSDDSFKLNQKLHEINMSGNKITTIPSSVKALKNLEYFDLSFNNIKCSCSNMHPVKGWNMPSNLALFGDCNSEGKSGSLMTYIQIYLRFCF